MQPTSVDDTFQKWQNLTRVSWNGKSSPFCFKNTEAFCLLFQKGAL